MYHSSEIELVYGTLQTKMVTTQQYALSQAMMGAWAKFAKNPLHGPGWNAVGTGTASSVLVGANSSATGGLYIDANAMVQTGSWDLGLWGNRDNVLSSGITVIDQNEVDYRCGLYDEVYAALLSLG